MGGRRLSAWNRNGGRERKYERAWKKLQGRITFRYKEKNNIHTCIFICAVSKFRHLSLFSKASEKQNKLMQNDVRILIFVPQLSCCRDDDGDDSYDAHLYVYLKYATNVADELRLIRIYYINGSNRRQRTAWGIWARMSGCSLSALHAWHNIWICNARLYVMASEMICCIVDYIFSFFHIPHLDVSNGLGKAIWRSFFSSFAECKVFFSFSMLLIRLIQCHCKYAHHTAALSRQRQHFFSVSRLMLWCTFLQPVPSTTYSPCANELCFSL